MASVNCEILFARPGGCASYLCKLRAKTGPETGLGLENMRHVISIHDVVSDTMHQFAPTYHNYVLYSNGGSKEAPKTVRAAEGTLRAHALQPAVPTRPPHCWLQLAAGCTCWPPMGGMLLCEMGTISA